MKIKIFVFILLTIFSKNIIAQTIEVNELTVSRVILKTKGLHQEGEREGPIVSFKLIIRNNTDSTIVLTPSTARFFLLFKYLDNDYLREFWPFSTFLFSERNPITLPKLKSTEVEITDRILLGTKVLKENLSSNGYDYSKEMIQLLPTIRIMYKDCNYTMTSIGIGSVKLEDFIYIPK